VDGGAVKGGSLGGGGIGPGTSDPSDHGSVHAAAVPAADSVALHAILMAATAGLTKAITRPLNIIGDLLDQTLASIEGLSKAQRPSSLNAL